MMTDVKDLINRLRKRSEIRRQIPNRKSVQEGTQDRIADLLDEAANALEELDTQNDQLHNLLSVSSYDY